MKATIDVKTREEGERIKIALGDATTRAFVLCMGALLPLTNDRARARVLQWARDHFADQPPQPPAPLEPGEGA